MEKRHLLEQVDRPDLRIIDVQSSTCTSRVMGPWSKRTKSARERSHNPQSTAMWLASRAHTAHRVVVVIGVEAQPLERQRYHLLGSNI